MSEEVTTETTHSSRGLPRCQDPSNGGDSNHQVGQRHPEVGQRQPAERRGSTYVDTNCIHHQSPKPSKCQLRPYQKGKLATNGSFCKMFQALRNYYNAMSAIVRVFCKMSASFNVQTVTICGHVAKLFRISPKIMSISN